MLAMTSEQNLSLMRRTNQFQVGDRVITDNCRLGTVIRNGKDEFGDYVIVQLDILPGEFAYDFSDLKKL